MTWTFFFFQFNLIQGRKKPHHSNRQEARAAGRAVITAQHLLESQPPGCCATTDSYCWESRAQKISRSGSTCFQTELGKIQTGSGSNERNSSICTSFKGTDRDRAGLRSRRSLSHSPRKPRGRSHLHTKGTDCSISSQIP